MTFFFNTVGDINQDINATCEISTFIKDRTWVLSYITVCSVGPLNDDFLRFHRLFCFKYIGHWSMIIWYQCAIRKKCFPGATPEFFAFFGISTP